MRYRNLFLLIAGFIAVFAVVETGLRAVGSPYLLTQRHGPGQIVLYSMGLIAILWFCLRVARVNPFTFFLCYLRDWRRMLSGFLFAWAIGTATMLALHVALYATGSISISQAAIAAYGPRQFFATVVALLAMLVLVLVEELIFRAFVLRYLRWSAERSVTIAAVLVAAAIFSVSHTVSLAARFGDVGLLDLLLGLFVLGTFLGAVYVATGSLACTMGVHAALLGFKVFLRKTQFVEYYSNGLTGGDDLRTGPLLWLLMLVFAVAAILARKWLWQRFWIERAYAPDPLNGAYGFRLETEATGKAGARRGQTELHASRG